MHYDETEKRAHDSQIVRTKETLKLNHGGPSYSQAPGTHPQIKALRQGRHRVWGLTHHRHHKAQHSGFNWDRVCNNTTDVKRGITKARMLAIVYMLQSTNSRFNQYEVEQIFPLCRLTA